MHGAISLLAAQAIYALANAARSVQQQREPRNAANRHLKGPHTPAELGGRARVRVRDPIPRRVPPHKVGELAAGVGGLERPDVAPQAQGLHLRPLLRRVFRGTHVPERGHTRTQQIQKTR